MKKTFNLLLIAFLLSSAVYAQKEEPYLTKSLAKENITDVYSRTSGGGILVEGVNANEARVEVYIRANNSREISKEEITTRLKEYKMIVEVSGNKLTATAEPRDSFDDWKRGLSISFKIYVPSKVSTDLSTSGGGIDLQNLSGTHNFSTSGGGLNLVKLSGKTRGRTSGGGITLKDSKDDISLSTSGGGITASNCSGNLRLNTSGGSIELDRLEGDIEAQTSGGPIRGESIRGNLSAHTSGGGVRLSQLACGLDASTSGGGMDIEIMEVVGAVKVNNSGGNIHLKMPGNKGLDLRLRGHNIKVVDLKNFSGDQEEDKITGKVNGGGTEVDVSTSGSLTFALK
jgi:DUF4097 and DUF4098 domain-containing protein YvlB